MTSYKEGIATIIAPNIKKISKRNEVFYNPKMSFSRDISLLYIKALPKDIEILCGMAGTGVRAIRYALEGNENVIANDLNPVAYSYIKKNAVENGVDLSVLNKDINMVEGKFDIIDIDPFGSPVRYLHPIMRLFRKEGHLFLSATDTSALYGSSKLACIRKYSAYPLKTSYSHEIGLRLLLGYACRQAACWGFGITPKISFYKDHYMRIHLQVAKGKRKADESMKKLGFINNCRKCLDRSFSKEPVCKCSCGERMGHAFPVWGGQLHDKSKIKEMVERINETNLHDPGAVSNFLNVLEGEIEVPYHWDSHHLSAHLDIPVPKIEYILSNLTLHKHACSKTHFSPIAFKTNATIKEMAQIFSK